MAIPLPRLLCAFLLSLTLRSQSILAWKDLQAGPHGVGFQARVVEDPTRTFGPPRGGLVTASPRLRPLLVATWYPAEPLTGSTMATSDYLPLLTASGVVAGVPEDMARIQRMTPEAWPSRPEVLDTLLKEPTWARMRAQAAPGRFPVLLYAPGGGYPVFDNAVLCEYLASHGYVVVATPSLGTYGQGAEGHVTDLETAAGDLAFLAGQIPSLTQADPQNLAVMGFSWGGVSSALLAIRHAHVRALVSLDSILRDARFTGLMRKSAPDFDPDRVRVPVLSIQSTPALGHPALKDDGFLDAIQRAGVTRAVVPLAHHDLASFGILMRRAATTGQGKDWAPVVTAYGQVCRLLRGFLDTHLKGEGPVSEDGPAVVTHRPARPQPPAFRDLSAALMEEGVASTLWKLRALRPTMPDTFQAVEPHLNQLGYRYLAMEQPDDALALFAFNTECFPHSFNAWDSLAEAHGKAGRREEALRGYQTACACLERDDTLSPAAKAEHVKRLGEVIARLRKPS